MICLYLYVDIYEYTHVLWSYIYILKLHVHGYTNIHIYDIHSLHVQTLEEMYQEHSMRVTENVRYAKITHGFQKAFDQNKCVFSFNLQLTFWNVSILLDLQKTH